MFTVQERERVQNQVLDWAKTDPRIVAAAVVGSMAHQPGDRFSDLDLTFGVRDGCPVTEVLQEWAGRLAADFDAIPLFDLPARGALYRVFLLPGCLQVDLSFAPASGFGAIGPQFRLLFGAAVDKPSPPAPDPGQLFGYGVHHAVRARVCIERSRFWHAEYWTSGVRDQALMVACVRLGLQAAYGRGFDRLPDEILKVAATALVRSADRGGLLQALRGGTALLLSEGERAGLPSARVSERLFDFVSMD